MADGFTPPAVVVGVDGSRAATRAALWAIDEAVSRDMPLRLITAVGTDGTDRVAATAAARSVADSVRAAGPAVRVDIDVVAGTPVDALVKASRTAAIVCVGAVGIHHFDHDRVGSTAAALAAGAHCPVAIVRGPVRGPVRPAPDRPGWVVAALDPTPDSAGVLQFAVGEARLRAAPLRVLGAWQSHGPDATPAPEGASLVHAQLDRRLEQWRHRYPDLDVAPVTVHGTLLDYLAEHAAEVQLVVVGARNAAVVEELLGPSGLARLGGDCGLVVVDPQRLL